VLSVSLVFGPCYVKPVELNLPTVSSNEGEDCPISGVQCPPSDGRSSHAWLDISRSWVALRFS